MMDPQYENHSLSVRDIRQVVRVGGTALTGIVRDNDGLVPVLLVLHVVDHAGNPGVAYLGVDAEHAPQIIDLLLIGARAAGWEDRLLADMDQNRAMSRDVMLPPPPVHLGDGG